MAGEGVGKRHWLPTVSLVRNRVGAGAAILSIVITLLASFCEQDDSQDRHDDDTGADGAHGLQVDGRNAHEHADDIGHEPRQPYHGTEGMKAAACLLAAALVSKACTSMSTMATTPVIAWMPKPEAADWLAMLLMVRVPVVSHARPIQNSNTYFRLRVPWRRSPKTPQV